MRRSAFILGLCLVLLVSGCITQEEAKDPTILRIKQAGKIVVGTAATYEPMEYVNDKGEIVGLDIDIAKEIASDLGVDLEIRDMEFDKLIDAVSKGEVDMIIAAITITQERAEKVSFSIPYFNAGQVIVVREENHDIKGPEDLRGKRIGVEAGTTSEKEALKYTDSSLVKSYESYDPLLADLKAGNIDALIIDYPAAKSAVRRVDGFKIVGNPFTDEFYGIAVRKGEQALLNEINKVITRLKQTGKLKELEDKWL